MSVSFCIPLSIISSTITLGLKRHMTICSHSPKIIYSVARSSFLLIDDSFSDKNVKIFMRAYVFFFYSFLASVWEHLTMLVISWMRSA